MPHINVKTSASINSEQEESLTKEFGKIITLIPGKTERWLMLSYDADASMAFSGNSTLPCALVRVELLGSATDSVYDKLTSAITDCISKNIGVPKNRIYVNYTEYSHWGFAGENF